MGRRSTIWTIGHSTRTAEAFLRLLKMHEIGFLADVRTIPGSSRYPQFNREELRKTLAGSGIAYEHFPGLGGLRKTSKSSPNTGWRNASFRGYADYMQTDEFAKHLASLERVARKYRVAVMCAEAVPWRCHRSLIADALTARGWEVRHIQSGKSAPVHTMTEFARVREGRIEYPAR